MIWSQRRRCWCSSGSVNIDGDLVTADVLGAQNRGYFFSLAPPLRLRAAQYFRIRSAAAFRAAGLHLGFRRWVVVTRSPRAAAFPPPIPEVARSRAWMVSSI